MTAITVEFKFSKEQKVKTVFGINGIISSRSYDPERGNSYYVKTGDDRTSNWYDERQLNEYDWEVHTKDN